MNAPGYKTTAFWLTILAVLIGAVLSSGLVCNAGEGVPAMMVCKVAGIAAVILSTLGYQVTRSATHRAAIAAASSANDSSGGAPAAPAIVPPYDPTKSGKG